ncbi:TonB-dependent receptor [Sphingomonas gilva]|uniref:TonB-dependent receptor n=1 Tax=Sphingomonas gilva TaxID=2305907 RepID=A0A396RRH6_9SPHN|nr:TonB-dependent receptor [Sphingomonas gilva]RHW18626.1 TonB-dependent receptor [Sphingomonas gilva]
MLRRPALLALLLHSGAAFAQETIVVTGRGLEEAAGERAYDVVTIDRDRIQASASERLEDVLRDVAGLQQFRRSDSRSAHPTSQGITLRGIGGNASSRALLLLDGVPQADPFGGWVAFPAFATDRLGRIRVTRGGGSGLFGPGALAGTIALESATPEQLAPLSASLAYGSRESLDARASASLVSGAGFATISAAYARGDGFAPIVQEQRGPADRAAPFEQASGAVRGVIAIAPAAELQANLSAFADRRDRGVDFTENGSEGADASLRLVGKGELGWSLLGYVQTRAFASRFASVEDDRSASSLVLDQYNVPSTGIGARGEIAPSWAGVDLRLGADLRAVSGETQELFSFAAGRPTRMREAGGRSLTAGAFVDASAELGAVTLNASGRLDRWAIGGGHLRERAIGGATIADTAFADRAGWEPTGRAGIAFRASEALSLRAAGYRGWRLPTLNELYRPFRVGADATAANAALAPETLLGAEIGVDLTPAPAVRLSATAFISRLDDAIANVTIARGPGTFPGVGFVSAAGAYRRRENLDSIAARGIELDATAAFGAFGARASYAYTDATVAASGVAADLDGLRPAQSPEHQASATIGWEGDAGAAVSLTGRYVSDQYEDDGNSRSLADAFTIDARAEMPVGRGFSIEARGENLADERIETGISGDGIVERASPRTLWIGLRYRR